MNPRECEHGSPAKFVTVVDRQRKTETDPYGDVEGPLGVEHVASMRMLRQFHANQTANQGRYLIAFLHEDLCRTES